MTDKFPKEVRSGIMSRIRSNHTKPEQEFRAMLKGLRLRYQAKLHGRPDFSSKKLKLAIFIDGCFWHKCPKCYKEPKSNRKYWLPKIKRNVERAKEVEKRLRNDDWHVLRFWEHEIAKEKGKCLKKVNSLHNKLISER